MTVNKDFGLIKGLEMVESAPQTFEVGGLKE